jgi:predicted ATPase with chaperone activity
MRDGYERGPMTTEGRTETSGILVEPPRGTERNGDDRPSGSSEDDATAPTLPRAPKSVEATGLSPSFLLELLLKIIHYAETATAARLARVIGLPRKQVNELLDALKTSRLCEVTSSSGDISGNLRYRLTEKGALRAEQALERCRYAGAAPVTPDQYEQVVGSPNLRRWRPSPEAIREAFQSLVLDSRTADFLERALHSARCTMLFGPSGTGKTHVLSEFLRRLGGEVVIPHAIYAYGQVIRVFDRMVHVPIDGTEPWNVPDGDNTSAAALNSGLAGVNGHDERWMRIRRPGLIVGGEVSSESLELGYDPLTRFYQAPTHLKAQGGVLVVDDFGRQKVRPADLLNRWIMAFERGRDNLLLRTGESIDIPFHVILVFSTNLNPADLADAAFLRRIPYKVQMPPPSPSQFSEILRKVADEYRLQFSDDDLSQVVSFVDRAYNHQLSGSLARDLLSLVVDNAEHEGREPVITVAAIELAYQQFTGIADDTPVSSGTS